MNQRERFWIALMLLKIVCLNASTMAIDVDWHSVDGGGAMNSTGDVYSVSGTIGQPDATTAKMSGGAYTVSGGFWVASITQPIVGCGEIPGDTDGDDDIDLVDFAEIQLCYTGPGGTATDECGCVDSDGDGDVDLVDFAAFQIAFTGSAM